MTAELAGLEERRRGAEAAFQRIDRLFSDLERRVQTIEQQQRPRRRGARAAHRRERRTGQAPAGTDRTRVRRRWPLAQSIAEQAQALRQQLAELETQLKTGRAALDQLREDRAARSSELAKLRSDLEHLEASCLAEVNVEAQVLRADAGDCAAGGRGACRRGRDLPRAAPADGADGPGEHDGARGVQGNGGAPRVPRNAAQGPDRVDRKYAGDDQGDRSDFAHQVRRGVCADQRELRGGVSRGSSRAGRPFCA